MKVVLLVLLLALVAQGANEELWGKGLSKNKDGKYEIKLNHLWESTHKQCSHNEIQCITTENFVNEGKLASAELSGSPGRRGRRGEPVEERSGFDFFRRTRRQWTSGQVAIVHNPDFWNKFNHVQAAAVSAFGSVDVYDHTVSIGTVINSARQVILLYLDGDSTWLTTNKVALEGFVTNGGGVWHNNFNTPGTGLFGVSFTSGSVSSSYALDPTHDIMDGGLASSNVNVVLGCFSAHSYMATVPSGFNVLMKSTSNQIVLAESYQNHGIYVVSSFTNPEFIYRPGSACMIDQEWSKVFFADAMLHAAHDSLGYNVLTNGCYNKCGSQANSGYFCDSICTYWGDCDSTYNYFCTLNGVHLPTNCIVHMTAKDLENIIDGATVMASGGGGAYADGQSFLDLLEANFNQGKVVRLLTQESGCPQPNGVCVAAFMGNPEVLHGWVNGTSPNKKYDMDNTVVGMIQNLMSITSNACQALAPIETGAVNTIIPLYTSILSNKYVMDVDGGGRAVPMLPLTFWAATDLDQSTAPLVASSVFNSTQTSPKFQPGYGYGFTAYQELVINTAIGGTPPSSPGTTWVTMTGKQNSYDPLAFNDIAFNGISIFGNLCSVGFYAMNASSGWTYGYQKGVSKLSSIGASLSVSIASLKTASNSCVIGSNVSNGKGILYSVNTWGDAAHQWSYQIVVLQNNDIVASLALNENALLWRYTSGSLTYAIAQSAGKCTFSNSAVTSLPSASTIKVIAPDSIAQVLSQTSNGGTEQLSPVSGPDIAQACKSSTSLLYAYNIIAPAQALWNNTKCAPPSNFATVCGGPSNWTTPGWTPPSGQNRCFCEQASNWYLVFKGAYGKNWSNYAWPSYVPIPTGQCA